MESGGRIAIVDNDGRALRSLEESCNERLAGAHVVRTFTSAVQALRCDVPVDLWLVDMSMEDMSGQDFCRQLRADGSLVPVLGVTSFSLERYHDRAVLSGMQGLVDKSDDDAIMSALARLMAGEVLRGFERPNLARHRIQHEVRERVGLSPREEEVLTLMARGLLDDEIAGRLGISEGTVRKHMQHVLEKLGLRTSRQAVAYWLNGHR